ncbi:hypothetical protein [Collimonas arenae]|uniref:hypothetical protein n=1 Tax=Collimonas arenae TaxID=279058 RepID=UPI0007784334|nr:hypothetical protein [Collimonas arenae]
MLFLRKKEIASVIIVFTGGAVAAPSHAACSNNVPASGVSVNCSGNVTTPVLAQTGSSSVAVTLDSTVVANIARSTSPIAFSVDTSSTIVNNGSVTLTGGGALAAIVVRYCWV